MSSNKPLSKEGGYRRDFDQHSSDGSTQTVIQNGTVSYDHVSDSFGEPNANAVDIEGMIIE
jgi:hypothetical protein